MLQPRDWIVGLPVSVYPLRVSALKDSTILAIGTVEISQAQPRKSIGPRGNEEPQSLFERLVWNCETYEVDREEQRPRTSSIEIVSTE